MFSEKNMKNILFLITLHPLFAVYNSKGVQETHFSYFSELVQAPTYQMHLVISTH